ncbi:hypothetical protein DRW41_03550 [Neobacillus piezotolerans]|uniref:Uncharacterized protein n=1 Tax=Neobacillus piezotolerans TaxID=2259171 RepID=A0A3D8GWR7_9BACI|nr:hypothetical protein DRW41_03550 [Neobacillus piezotolerans]
MLLSQVEEVAIYHIELAEVVVQLDSRFLLLTVTGVLNHEGIAAFLLNFFIKQTEQVYLSSTILRGIKWKVLS